MDRLGQERANISATLREAEFISSTGLTPNSPVVSRAATYQQRRANTPANSRETTHQLQNSSRPPLASLTYHNNSGSNNTLLEISKKLDRIEETTLLRTRTRVIRRPNRGVPNANSRTTQIVTAAVASRGASRGGRQARGRRAQTQTHSSDLVNNINEYDLEEDSSRIAWQRMVVIADEKMHFTKRQSKKQHRLLKMAVSVGNKIKVMQNKKEICVFCQQEEFVYSADPCGHAIFCSNCILAGIKPSKYTYTLADGTIATHHSYFVPVKCPLCRAIIGSLYKEVN